MVHNLMIAQYLCVEKRDEEQYRHYGLNFDRYTHFTSPIRRYADLLVHRLLTISLKEGKETREKLHGLDYSEYAVQISDKSFNARVASRQCVHLFHTMLLKQHGPYVFDSLIWNIEYGKLKIFVEELNMDLTVPLTDDLRINYITFLENEMKLTCHFRAPLNLASHLNQHTSVLNTSPHSKPHQISSETHSATTPLSSTPDPQLTIELP